MIFFRKNTLENDISGIIETAHIHPRKYGISCDRKIKDDRKVYLYKKFQGFSVLLWKPL